MKIISLKYSALSDVGCVRSDNEDMAYVAGRLIRDSGCSGDLKYESTDTIAFAVADGMGGCEGGEVASEIVCRSFASFVKTGLPGKDTDAITALKEWAIAANRLILDTAGLRPDLAEMATTFTGLLFAHGHLWLINIGDSRCYRIRGGILKQLSVDHSERERTKNSAVPSNLIYNYMGNTPSGFTSDVSELYCLEGDSYLLCSDGLSDLVPDDIIESNADDIQTLVGLAKAAGGRDNITVIIINL